jgi:signal transduction histidine kinase
MRRAEPRVRERRAPSVPDRRLPRLQAPGPSWPLRGAAGKRDREASEPGAERVPRVLLVDERAENLAALETLLRPLGARLVKARSGEEALLHLLRERFALIVLDVHMPRLEGLRIAELIHQRKQTRNVPILFLSALSREAAYVFKGYSRRAVDYLLQPLDPELLRAKVRMFCDLWSRGERIRSQAAQSALKNVFLASSAHRMRKGLAAAKADAQAAIRQLEDAGDAAAASALQQMSARIDGVAGLVSDMVDVGRVGADLSLRRTVVDLAVLAREVAERMQMLARGHRLLVRSPGRLPALADRERLDQLFTSLLGYVIRYAAPGATVEMVLQPAAGNQAQLIIQDRGLDPGRERQAVVHPVPGATPGIGLAIAKGIVEHHGGSLWMDPGARREGRVSFVVQLPAAPR